MHIPKLEIVQKVKVVDQIASYFKNTPSIGIFIRSKEFRVLLLHRGCNCEVVDDMTCEVIVNLVEVDNIIFIFMAFLYHSHPRTAGTCLQRNSKLLARLFPSANLFSSIYYVL